MPLLIHRNVHITSSCLAQTFAWPIKMRKKMVFLLACINFIHDFTYSYWHSLVAARCIHYYWVFHGEIGAPVGPVPSNKLLSLDTAEPTGKISDG